MSPHRDHHQGTFIIDLRFRRVGRIRRASGTLDKKMFGKMRAMLQTLFDRGRLDLLRSLQSGVISPMELWDAYRANRLESLPSAETIKGLSKSVTKWLNELEGSGEKGSSADSIANHQQGLRYLLKNSKHPERVTVHRLPLLLAKARKTMKDTARSFNQTRSTAMAFLKATLGADHPLYAAVSAVQQLETKPKVKKNPQTPEQIVALTKGMAEPWRTVAWQMFLSGMGPKEYMTDGWEIGPDRVFIHGVKRDARNRTVPLIGKQHMARGVVTPTDVLTERVEKLLNRALKNAGKPKDYKEVYDSGVRSYDMRRSYSNMLEAAGIPRTRRKLYMGHGVKDVTDLYERHEVSAFLAEDAKKLEEYMAPALTQSSVAMEGGSR